LQAKVKNKEQQKECGLIMDFELWIIFPPEAGRLISAICYLIYVFSAVPTNLLLNGF
jgi:hypothetical protein